MAKSNNKRKVKVDSVGQAHISSTFNNIIISMTNASGQVISWSSAGKQGFRETVSTISSHKGVLNCMGFIEIVSTIRSQK